MFDDLIVNEILSHLMKRELLVFGLVCRQWHLRVKDLYTGAIDGTSSKKNLDLSMVRKMGRYFKSLRLSNENTMNWKTLFQCCSGVRDITLNINLTKESLENDLKLFAELLKKIARVKNLWIGLISSGSLPLFFLKEVATRAKELGMSLHDVSNAPSLPRYIESICITELKLFFDPTPESFNLIGEKFHYLRKLYMELETESLTDDDFQGGNGEGPPVILVFPGITNLEELIVFESDHHLAFPSNASLPNLRVVDIKASSIVFPESTSNNIWPNVYNLRLEGDLVHWCGVLHHFPNVHRLELYGYHEKIFPHSIAELEELKKLTKLVVESDTASELINYMPYLVNLSELVFFFCEKEKLMLPLLYYCSNNLPSLAYLYVDYSDFPGPIFSILDGKNYPLLPGLTKLNIRLDSEGLMSLLEYCSLYCTKLSSLVLRSDFCSNSSRLVNTESPLSNLLKICIPSAFPINFYVQLIKIAPKLVEIDSPLDDESLQILRQELNNRDMIITSKPPPFPFKFL